MVLGANGGGDPSRDRPLVELVLLKGQGEGVDRALGGALSQVGDDRRINAAGEQDRQWHVAGEVKPQPLLQYGGETVGVHDQIEGAVGDMPEVLTANLRAGTVEFKEARRPDQLNAVDGGTGAELEALPYAGWHGLRVEVR